MVLAFVLSPAWAGFFKPDRYDPDMVHFGTRVVHTNVAMGAFKTWDVAPGAKVRPVVAPSLDFGVFLLPGLVVGARGGLSIMGVRMPIPESEDHGGFRTVALHLDAIGAIEGRAGRVYGFHNLVDYTTTLGRPGSGWKGAPTRWTHFGAGVELRFPADDKDRGLSLQAEWRRSRFTLVEPVPFAPDSGYGDALLFSFGIYNWGKDQ